MTRAVFTQGTTWRHVLVMTGASATGLLTMFSVDLVDMYFLTLLGEHELVAAVGYAGTLMFFLVAVSIGLQIALGALVARSEGAHRRDLARRYCTSGLVFNLLVSVVITALAMPLTFSIANGIAFGFITWVVIKTLAGRFKDINPALAVLAALFIIKFGFFNA